MSAWNQRERHTVSYPQRRDLDPMAQAQIEREIVRLSSMLTPITEEVADAAVEAAQAEVDFKLAHAKELLALRREPGTVPIKDALALDACAREFEAMKITEAVYKALQEKGRNVRAQLDSLRSVNANARAAVTWAHGEGP